MDIVDFSFSISETNDLADKISQKYMQYNGPNIIEVHVIQWTKYHRGQCFTMDQISQRYM